jgi:hypothetical protein
MMASRYKDTGRGTMSKRNLAFIDTDPAAIAMNRLGRVTAAQRSRLKLGPLWLLSHAAVIEGVIFLGALGVGVWVGLNGDIGALVGGALSFAVFAGIVLAGVFWGRRVARRARAELFVDLDQGRIVQVVGHVVLEPGAAAGCVARVAACSLRATDGSPFVSLMPGRYRFYALPLSERLLSAERLLAAEPDPPEPCKCLPRAEGLAVTSCA